MKHEKTSIPIPKTRSSISKDRVTENITTYGAESLSDAQLIGILLNSEAMDRIEKFLVSAGSMKQLFNAGPAELREHGLSELEATRLSAMPELMRRMTRIGVHRPGIPLDTHLGTIP